MVRLRSAPITPTKRRQGHFVAAWEELPWGVEVSGDSLVLECTGIIKGLSNEEFNIFIKSQLLDFGRWRGRVKRVDQWVRDKGPGLCFQEN